MSTQWYKSLMFASSFDGPGFDPMWGCEGTLPRSLTLGQNGYPWLPSFFSNSCSESKSVTDENQEWDNQVRTFKRFLSKIFSSYGICKTDHIIIHLIT